MLCQECGKEFVSYNKTAKFCSRNCYKKSVNAWNENELKTVKILYPVMTANEINDLIDRTGVAIRYRAKALNVKKNFIGKKRAAQQKHGTRDTFFSWMTKQDEIDWFNEQHWGRNRPLKQMAEELGVGRRNYAKRVKDYGCKARTNSEDSHRRYAQMSRTERKQQTVAANKKKRELMKNPKRLAEHVRRTLEAQNFRESKPEKLLKAELDKHGMDYKDQHQIAKWFIDITFPEHRLAVEVDGVYWHGRPEQIEKDKKKDGWLKAHNWDVLRITDEEIYDDIDKCVQRIEDKL